MTAGGPGGGRSDSPSGGTPLPPGAYGETRDGLIIRRVPVGALWYRIHLGDNASLWYGGSESGLRFNDPGPRTTHPRAPIWVTHAKADRGSYRVCYFGVTPEAAFVETFFRRLPNCAIAMSELAARRITRVRVVREVSRHPCVRRPLP